METNQKVRQPFLGSRWLTGLGLTLVAFIAASLGSLQYSGMIGTMGEWQFARLGFYLPIFTVAAWVGLALLAVALVARLTRQSDGGLEQTQANSPSQALIIRNILILVGFVAGLVALVGAVNLVMLPGATKVERVASPANLDAAIEGSTRLQGFRAAGPISRYSEGLLVWKNDTFLVPLSGATRDAPVQVFAQITQYEAGTKLPSSFRGILRRNALPHELTALYASQAVSLDKRVAVLYRDSFSMGFSALLLIGEASTVAILSFLGAFWLHRRRSKS